MEEQSDRTLLRTALRNRCKGQNFDFADFLHECGSVSEALLYAELYAPTFIEIEGEVFFKYLGAFGGDRAIEIRRLRSVSSAALTEFVNNCNWLEVPYLFSRSRGTDQEDRALAQALADTWLVRLRGLYPDRLFKTRLLEPVETGSVIGVCFEKTLA